MQTQHSLLLINLFPAVFGHLIVVPRDHFHSLSDLPIEVSSDMFALAVKAANILREALSSQGTNIFLNEGEVAGQTIEHLHIHIIPRSYGDGLENFRRKEGNERKEITESWKEQLKKTFS